MYRIRGENGEEQGPHSAETLKSFLRGGNITLLTVARREDGSEWKPLGEYADFVVLSSDLTKVSPVATRVGDSPVAQGWTSRVPAGRRRQYRLPDPEW